MRRIDRIVIHCSATSTQDIGVAEIRRWHKARGWKDVGYHYVIRRDGTVEDGRPNQEIGAHARGFNRHSLGLCLIGGIGDDGKPSNNFTDEQWWSLWSLIQFLQFAYNVSDSNVIGHRDLPRVKKACPCFDVQKWIKS